MQAKEYLYKVRNSKLEIERLKSRHKELLAHLYTIKTTDFTGVFVKNSVPRDLSGKILRVLEHEKTIITKIQILLDMQANAEDEIKRIDAGKHTELYQQILLRYYVNVDSWHKIAADLHFDYSYIHRLHGAALEAFRRVFRR